MELFSLAGSYVVWHYSSAIKDIAAISSNFFWFLYHFFSLPVIVRTFFSPWKRMHEEYKPGLHVEAFFSALIVNSLMRVVGVVFRTAVIFLGVLALLLAAFLCAVSFLAWVTLPFVLILLFYTGLKELLL